MSNRSHLVVRLIVAAVLTLTVAAIAFITNAPAQPTALLPPKAGAAEASHMPLPVQAPAIATPASKLVSKRVAVPALSIGYRLKIERAVAAEFGLVAPVAVVAAQLQQESGFNPKAQSPYAIGLAQFTPSTAKWLPTICPHLGEFDPWSADQSIQAAACYDAWLHRNIKQSASACDRLAFMLADYNGGTKWRQRDQALAAKAGRDATAWFDEVETLRSRGVAAHKENRDYVRRILRVLMPAYAAEGWPGGEACT